MEQLEEEVTKVKKGKANYIYSIIGVALVLFFLGILGWIVISAGQLTNALKENIEVSVILNDNTQDAKAKELSAILEKQAFVSKIEYISKELAAEKFKKDFGEDFIQVLEYNPLYTSINLHLNADYVNTDSLIKIKNFIEQSNIVREVFYQKNLVDIMNNNVKKIGIAILIISILLIIAVIFLIDNTIRLAMFSNRFLIKTMQMVGATRWFITKPFNIRSVINGLISGGIAIFGILLVKIFSEKWIPELKSVSSNKWLLILCVSILLIGVIISFLSTTLAVRKYLRTQLDELY
ncbi:MAG: permease-like cell division protein FtsX [Chitinophagaceae bacterium]|nr:permease-like cell division protein FtsX [Chitinophagaceae bacterium]